MADYHRHHDGLCHAGALVPKEGELDLKRSSDRDEGKGSGIENKTNNGGAATHLAKGRPVPRVYNPRDDPSL
jgi:hypothetical protein